MASNNMILKKIKKFNPTDRLLTRTSTHLTFFIINIITHLKLNWFQLSLFQ